MGESQVSAVFLSLCRRRRRQKVDARIVKRSIKHSSENSLPFPKQTTKKQYSFSLTTFSPSGKLVQVRFEREKGNEKRGSREMKKPISCSSLEKSSAPQTPLSSPFSSCSLSHFHPTPLSLPTPPKHQIEHALNAVNAGATALGIRAVDGVVLATEKKARSPLVDGATISKLSPVTPNSGLAYAGMGPDSRVLVRRARKSAQAYLRTYGEEIPVAQLCRETAAVMQEFTQRGGVRPFGVSLLMAGVDAGGGPQLYQIDPSGSYFAWKASAVGKNAQDAR